MGFVEVLAFGVWVWVWLCGFFGILWGLLAFGSFGSFGFSWVSFGFASFFFFSFSRVGTGSRSGFVVLGLLVFCSVGLA